MGSTGDAQRNKNAENSELPDGGTVVPAGDQTGQNEAARNAGEVEQQLDHDFTQPPERFPMTSVFPF